MSFMVEVPAAHAPELTWVMAELLHRRLGLDWPIVAGSNAHATLIRGADRQLVLTDGFFADTAPERVAAARLPAQLRPDATNALTLPLLDPDTIAGFEGVCAPLPVLFGSPRIERAANEITIHLDLPGSSFFLLSRFEEWLDAPTDAHGRFPAAASVAARAGVLERPLVDELAALLRRAIRLLWPNALPADVPGTLAVRATHDVDRPFAWLGAPIGGVLRLAAGRLARARPGGALRTLGQAMLSNLTAGRRDPYNTFELLMTLSERQGRTACFYLLPDAGTHPLDARHGLTDPALTSVIRSIAARGHTLGVHPGYLTMDDAAAARASLERWQAALSRLDCLPPVRVARQHYLRWRFPATPRTLESLGVAEDSSLYFSTAPGFRCSTCHPFRLWDLQLRRPFELLERPLVLMDSCLLPGLAAADGLETAAVQVRRLQQACGRHGGEFVFLWHNSSLETVRQRALLELCHDA